MLESYIEQLQSVGTLDELNDQVVALRDLLDVEHVVYHSVNSTGEQYAALTYSPEWVQHYLDQDYSRVDPVVLACYRRFHPIDWKRLDWSSKSSRNFMGEAVDNGIGNLRRRHRQVGRHSWCVDATSSSAGDDDGFRHIMNCSSH